MAAKAMNKTIRRCGKTGKVTERVTGDKFRHIYKDKKTRHHNSISLTQDEIDDIMCSNYTALRIMVEPTDEVIIIEDFYSLINSAKKIPMRDKITGKFKGWSFFLVANFR